MKRILLDDNWYFRRGLLDSLGIIENDPGVCVNLPHDGMINTPVTKDAPAQYDSGYYNGDVCNYTKYVDIPNDWDGQSIGLYFDGAMMHAHIEVNGCKVGEHHYGYSPFYVDITDYVAYGEKNRITVNINTGVQSSSRWYTGSGLFRGVTLCVAPKVHVPVDGIYAYTKEADSDYAFIEAQVDVVNSTADNRIVDVDIALAVEKTGVIVTNTRKRIQVNSFKEETAYIALCVEKPLLWDCDNPNLYDIKVTATDIGTYRTRLIEAANPTVDEAHSLFGIRTITADAIRGLRINGKTTKLKGGCIHHDNGLLGAASLYETEARKVATLKKIGFNAIRTAHNPPSSALVEACDRLGMYIFDEAFDAWGIAKRTGDYSQYFATYWKSDLTAFVRRDRVHPAVIMWSTGNEIPERGGLNNGYTVATQLATTIKKLDGSRPVSNGICSMWSGLDDYLAEGQNHAQNANEGVIEDLWEKVTEPFINGLDIVGYNYFEDAYEHDHELYPDRVILGSENFPKEIGFRWPMVESLPYVIGDFTWTAWDYLGEAGIGKAIYVDQDDARIADGEWGLMPPGTSHYPWRTSNDADVDITGYILPQGTYRSVVWGDTKTYLYSFHPDYYGKTQILSPWGFPHVEHNWNYKGHEDKPVELIVFSNAEEVAILINGEAIARKEVSKERPLPNTVRFDVSYIPGTVEAVSYCDGVEVSRDCLVSSKEPAKIRLVPEKTELRADGHDVAYVSIEVLDCDDKLVTDASIEVSARLEGCGYLAGFGTGNPITEEDYTEPSTTTFCGRAMAVIRSGYEKGSTKLTVCSSQIDSAEVCIENMA